MASGFARTTAVRSTRSLPSQPLLLLGDFDIFSSVTRISVLSAGGVFSSGILKL